jgi:NOL1/NOP2/sun family putative RNA methylase
MKNEKQTYEDYVKRYCEIIDDFDAFLKYSQMSLPRIIWTNYLKANTDSIEALLKNEAYEKLSWWEGAFKLTSDFKPGRTVEFLSGKIHVQEEVSMYPVLALNPTPGDLVLDLCAAPGNKTAGICLKMNDQGLVIGNDKKTGRVALLQNTITRLGFTNCIITNQDGTDFQSKGKFDKVLIDAPCSAEGNIRKSKWSRRDENHSLKFQPLQQKLLKQGIDLTRRGGEIVYSTCTYSPDENEAVVNAVLNESVELIDIDFPEELTYSSGIPYWKGQQYDFSVKKCYRFWPHQNNTGGFFVAKFKKF